MTDPGMKCVRCKGPATHRYPSHNARFCDECLAVFVERQAEKAIKKFRMLRPGQKVLVAVSGGKDSLALWQILEKLGYETEGLHLDLEIPGFSRDSLGACRKMAEILGRKLHVRNFKQETGHSMQAVVFANRRGFCQVCGTMKRYMLNRYALELGFDTVASGHHLDDEAGRLLGNLIRRHHKYLKNQWPVLEGLEGRLIKKIKPLCRLENKEIKAYAKSQDLPAAFGKCPKAKGATLPYYQQAMELLEQKMPGTKRNMYLGFLREKGEPPEPPELSGTCSVCGAPSHLEVCNACRLLEKTRLWKLEKQAEREEKQAEERRLRQQATQVMVSDGMEASAED